MSRIQPRANNNNKPPPLPSTTTTAWGGGSRIQTKKKEPSTPPPASPKGDEESVDENMLDGEEGAIPDIASTASEGVTPRIPDATEGLIPDVEDDDPEDDMGDPLDSARAREREKERQREKEKAKEEESRREKEKRNKSRKKSSQKSIEELERQSVKSPRVSGDDHKTPRSARREKRSDKTSSGADGKKGKKGSNKEDTHTNGSDDKPKRKKGSFFQRRNDVTTTQAKLSVSQTQSLRPGGGGDALDVDDGSRRNTIAGYRPDDKKARDRKGNDDDDDGGDSSENDNGVGRGLQRRYALQDIFDYHVLSVEAIEARFRTSIRDGLSTSDAEQKLSRDGPNHPTVKSPTLDIDEFATKKVLVRRDGYRKAIESRELVVGDVVTLEAGPVFADMRVVGVNTIDLLVDNSTITGDPEPIPRQVDMTTENYLTSENLIFYGTSIVDGEGTGIVVRTGDGTLLARMIKDNESAKLRKEGGPKAKKPIMKQLAKNGLLFKEPNAASRLGRVTTLVVDAAGVLTENKSSVSYIMIDKEIREATSALPEGEPTFNALLRACVLGCNAFFQVPDGVNKTKLNIDHLDVEEWDNTSGALLRFYEKNPTLGMKRRDDAFCSEIMRNAWEKVADDLNDCHVSVHRWAKGPHVGGEDETKASFLAVLTGPLEVVLQYCSTYMMLGQSKKLDNASKKEIREHAMTLHGYGEVVVAFAQLPLNSRDYPHDFEFDFYTPNFPLKEMCFLGLVSMGSRVYKTIPSAIERCKLANIRIIMVSQDSAAAVKVMARKMGLITKETPEDIAKKEGVMVDELSPEKLAQAKALVLDGSQMALMMEEGLSHIMRTHDEVVISGTDASQKLKIVRAAQMIRKSEVVVATGAQLADCAGLAVADVGIAAPGSVEGVQQAADAIMTGGALDSILDAVEFVRKKGEGGGCTLQ